MGTLKLKAHNYGVFLAPMSYAAKLKPSYIMIWSIIHGFSQAENNKFTGTIDYLCQWTNLSKRAVIDILKHLTDLKYISKEIVEINGVTFCHYKSNYNNLFWGGEEISQVVTFNGINDNQCGEEIAFGSEETAPNINNNINSSLIDNKKEKTSKKENYTDEDLQTFEVARKYYKGVRKGLQTEFANFTKHKDWKQCLPLLLPAMLLENADKEQTFKRNGFQQQWKNFSTWINQRCWETEYPNLTQQEIDNANNIQTDANGNVTVQEPLPRPTRAEIMEHPERYPEGTVSRCGEYYVRNRTWYNV